MKGKRLLTLLIALLVVTSLFLIIEINKKTAGKVVYEEEIIEIGAILPLSGANAFYGESLQEGISLAESEINSHGGIKGKRIKVLYEDSTGDTKIGLSAYNKLKEFHNPVAVLSFLTHVTLGIAPESEKDKIILFSIPENQ